MSVIIIIITSIIIIIISIYISVNKSQILFNPCFCLHLAFIEAFLLPALHNVL